MPSCQPDVLQFRETLEPIYDLQKIRNCMRNPFSELSTT